MSEIKQRKWYIDILIFVILTVLNLYSVVNYEAQMKLQDYYSPKLKYQILLVFFDDIFGRFSGLIIFELIAILFLYIGIKKYKQ